MNSFVSEYVVSLYTVVFTWNSISEYYGRWDHHLRIEIENTKLVESEEKVPSAFWVYLNPILDR